MESPKFVNMFVLKTAIALLVLSSATTAEESKLVKEVCGKTRVPYNECVAALNSDLRMEAIKEIRELTFLSLDLAMANSSEAMGYVGGMVENSPPALKPVLYSCSGLLSSSYRNFHTAAGDLMANASRANYDVILAMGGPTNCRRAMKDANVSIPAVSTRCSYVEFFVQLCYTTTLLDMLS
ncbi:uncharacterized protein LOC116203115 [Punica granatum]|uniref:Uncharacterized protein LOC116203115 n=2 Tax=Punica granatum TaxID=22663 RepID=A0A6P8D2M1_PUNGR|nr:uncharacterized protein LOC116203115 [Punica granatum]PKI58048.1 hypothetical protein CRG98_021541 [Punica granatum]